MVKARWIGNSLMPLACEAHRNEVSCESGESRCGGNCGVSADRYGNVTVKCVGHSDDKSNGSIKWFRVIAVYEDGIELDTALVGAPDVNEPEQATTDCEEFGILIGRIARSAPWPSR